VLDPDLALKIRERHPAHLDSVLQLALQLEVLVTDTARLRKVTLAELNRNESEKSQNRRPNILWKHSRRKMRSKDESLPNWRIGSSDPTMGYFGRRRQTGQIASTNCKVQGIVGGVALHHTEFVIVPSPLQTKEHL